MGVCHEFSAILVPAFDVFILGPDAVDQEREEARQAAVNALAESTMLLQIADGPNDIACDVELHLMPTSPDVWGRECAFPPREIGSSVALSCALDHSEHFVKIVSEITYCKNEAVRYPEQEFVGCALIDGPSMIVASDEAIDRLSELRRLKGLEAYYNAPPGDTLP
jgi:hypothetical protein